MAFPDFNSSLTSTVHFVRLQHLWLDLPIFLIQNVEIRLPAWKAPCHNITDGRSHHPFSMFRDWDTMQRVRSRRQWPLQIPVTIFYQVTFLKLKEIKNLLFQGCLLATTPLSPVHEAKEPRLNSRSELLSPSSDDYSIKQLDFKQSTLPDCEVFAKSNQQLS